MPERPVEAASIMSAEDIEDRNHPPDAEQTRPILQGEFGRTTIAGRRTSGNYSSSWSALLTKELTILPRIFTSPRIAGPGEEEVWSYEPEEKPEVEDPLMGTVIEGSYEILEVLGRGGMAVVYLAHHLPSDRLVAMKRIKVNSAEDIMRFGREIRSHSRLTHKNIVQYMEFIATNSGQFFLVMERIKGLNLLDITRSIKRIDGIDHIATIMIQSLDALAYAHNNGVIHRDLKTSNVVLVKEDENDAIVVKILDFGIARMEGEQRITFSGKAIGSPMYMSPEQCAGKTLTARSDLYSLGVVAYEIITGRPPYYKGSVRDIMVQHCTPHVVPESMCDSVPHISHIELLNEIVQKALATDQAERWQTAAQFRAAFEYWYEAVQDDLPVTRIPADLLTDSTCNPSEEINYALSIQELDQVRNINRTSSMQSSLSSGKLASYDEDNPNCAGIQSGSFQQQKSTGEQLLRSHQEEYRQSKRQLIRLASLAATLGLSLIVYFAVNHDKIFPSDEADDDDDSPPVEIVSPAPTPAATTTTIQIPNPPPVADKKVKRKKGRRAKSAQK
ncbi:MAG: serine/threonine protein kinase [Candidatus Obscuribacterales bacterium]|nr:serine/threonine protein kinase [Candidatus Obscuribacterales bacterium]